MRTRVILLFEVVVTLPTPSNNPPSLLLDCVLGISLDSGTDEREFQKHMTSKP